MIILFRTLDTTILVNTADPVSDSVLSGTNECAGFELLTSALDKLMPHWNYILKY